MLLCHARLNARADLWSRVCRCWPHPLRLPLWGWGRAATLLWLSVLVSGYCFQQILKTRVPILSMKNRDQGLTVQQVLFCFFRWQWRAQQKGRRARSCCQPCRNQKDGKTSWKNGANQAEKKDKPETRVRLSTTWLFDVISLPLETSWNVYWPEILQESETCFLGSHWQQGNWRISSACIP